MITPGPWKWFNDGDLASADGKLVLRPDANRGIPSDEDAALIASAPDLLAENAKLLLQNNQMRKALERINAMRKRLPDPDFNEQKTTANGIAEIIKAVLT